MVLMHYGIALGTFWSKEDLQMHPITLQCSTIAHLEGGWVHLETVFALQMYPMQYHSAYRS